MCNDPTEEGNSSGSFDMCTQEVFKMKAWTGVVHNYSCVSFRENVRIR
jgi:hypothetical protein